MQLDATEQLAFVEIEVHKGNDSWPSRIHHGDGEIAQRTLEHDRKIPAPKL
jgi:hypothetical protein